MPSRAQRRAMAALSPDPAPTINARSPAAIAVLLLFGRVPDPASPASIAQNHSHIAEPGDRAPRQRARAVSPHDNIVMTTASFAVCDAPLPNKFGHRCPADLPASCTDLIACNRFD
jgi:hypothetical protein